MLRIYLARHGQTEWNAQQRLQGSSDIPLNETGRLQARQLAAHLDGVVLDRIYCSELSRSRQTAEVLEGRAPIDSLPGLNEQSLGKFEGVALDGSNPEAEEEFRRRFADPDDEMDGGESQRQHLARVRVALAEIRRRHPSGTVLIIGHGGTNSMVLVALLDLLVEEAARIRQGNDELYVIDVLPERDPLVWKLIPPESLEEL